MKVMRNVLKTITKSISIAMISKQVLRKLSLNNLMKTNKRLISSSYGLIYEEFGDPIKVVKKVEMSWELDKVLEPNEILMRYLASPINPADINTIQGVYAIKPQLPAIGGNEGVAQVIKVGPQVTRLRVGDWVIPGLSASGTWRSHAIHNANDVLVIDNSIDVLSAAQLSVNPCTAYRMLKDFVDLKKGLIIEFNDEFS
jgi:trans-2-enoyl-CoA reductase